MDTENQEIRIRVNNFNINHFVNLGYNVNKNDYINILVKDLPVGSGLKVKVECSYCGNIFYKSYRRYLETKNSLCCKNCKNIKMTNTSISKYGNACSLRNPEIQEKSKNKNLENLGVQYPFQNKSILKKCFDSIIEKYGKTSFQNSISNQQRIFHLLYGGILNYSEYPYRLDIFFKDENIYFEYDGSGHELSTKIGRYTKEDFDNKAMIRKLFLRNKGYKEFRIISKDDILPNNAFLLNLKDKAFDILLNTKNTTYIYNINTKTESFNT